MKMLSNTFIYLCLLFEELHVRFFILLISYSLVSVAHMIFFKLEIHGLWKSLKVPVYQYKV